MKRRTHFSLRMPAIVLVMIISFFYYGLYRNEQTYLFRHRVRWHTLLALKADKFKEYNDSIYSRYSYNDFMYSFKPLKVKYWYTEEEIEKYKLYLVDR